MYNRGGMVIEAIRQIEGDETFLQIMRTWEDEHALLATARPRTSSRSSSAISDEDDARWDEFFTQWLYTAYAFPDKPTITPDTF